MASDKETMLSSANYYAGLVAAAKNDCADVFVQLTTPISEIDRCWKGQSGAQLIQKLEDAKQNIKKLYDRLLTLETQMKVHATDIYNAWPESEDVT